MKKLLALMLAAALALSLVACGGGNGAGDTNTSSTGNGDTTSTDTPSMTKEEMLERRKKAIIFYLENGNPQRRRLLKDLTKIYLRLWERTFAYGEYGKLWEWIEKKY